LNDFIIIIILICPKNIKQAARDWQRRQSAAEHRGTHLQLPCRDNQQTSWWSITPLDRFIRFCTEHTDRQATLRMTCVANKPYSAVNDVVVNWTPSGVRFPTTAHPDRVFPKGKLTTAQKSSLPLPLSFLLSLFFFFRTDYMIPQTFTVTSSIGCFYFLVFLFYNFLVVGSVR